MKAIDNFDQWHAWRIGRDTRSDGTSHDCALARLENVFPQAELVSYFDAGFAGNPCPHLTAPNPE